MIGRCEYVLVLFYYKKHQHSACNNGYMKYDHIRGEPTEINRNGLFWPVQQDAFKDNQKNIQIKKPIAEKKNFHIGRHNIDVIKIGNKSKEDHNKNKIDPHEKKGGKIELFNGAFNFYIRVSFYKKGIN